MPRAPTGSCGPVPLVKAWGLALAPRIFGDESAAALAANPWWTLAPFLVLAVALGWIAARRARNS